MKPKIAYIVTEDWAFWRHRLPMARAARDAGFEVHVLTRVGTRQAEIEREGFILHPLTWQRSRNSIVGVASAIHEIRKILSQIAPDIVHNIALKPSVIGSLTLLTLPSIATVNSINGLGSMFLATSPSAQAQKLGMRVALSVLLNRRRTRTIVQNPDDAAAMIALGIRPDSIVLVPGSGVDTDAMQPLTEPPPPLKMAYVGRMLADKGLEALMDAHRILRRQGQAIELLLVGEPDAENPTSFTQDQLEAWGREPGVAWLGHIEDISEVWSQCAIAVLPSRREGLPKSLLEAAAFGRPLIATDVPGCREIAIEGETGLLAPLDDATAIAAAIAKLAGSPGLRASYGATARRYAVERFSANEIGRQTVAVYRSLDAERETTARRG